MVVVSQVAFGLVLVVLCMATTSALPARVATTLTFDPDLALRYVRFSSVAHCSKDKLMSWNCGKHCSELGNFTTIGVMVDEKLGGYGFVGYDDDTIVVSYRGSVNTINWIEDFKFAKVHPFAGDHKVEVHDGFYQMHEALMPQLLKFLESAPARASVVVTGHSLGASLAVLAALNITVERPDLPVPFMYDYGQPRVGNAAFVDMLHSSGIQMFRIINQHDIVPHIPPEAAGYKHMPTEVWWHNGTYQVCSNTDGEDKSCSNRIPELNPNDHPTYPPFPPGIDVTCGG